MDPGSQQLLSTDIVNMSQRIFRTCEAFVHRTCGAFVSFDNFVHPVIVFLACAHGLGPGLGMDDLTWTLDHSNYEDNSEYFLLVKLLFLCIADTNKLRSLKIWYDVGISSNELKSCD